MSGKSVKIILLTLGVCLVVTASGYAGYYYGVSQYRQFFDAFHVVRKTTSQYPFVAPLVGVDTPNALSINQFTGLNTKVSAIFNANKNVVARYSVYFRDLNKGLWIGINENDKYNPASMLKVALAVAVYKQAENDPAFLQSETVYTPVLAKINTDNPYNDPSELKVGQSYQIEDLLKKMLVDSDNGAKDILGNVVNQNIMTEVYTDLGIDPPSDNSDYFISAKKYTVFLRTLYGATYLTSDYSNRLLKLLSAARFKDALVAGVPATIQVAHKYGEHINSADNTIDSTELHDCGIVYLPTNPYLLCVMTEGKSESDLAAVIGQVSKAVYDTMSAKK